MAGGAGGGDPDGRMVRIGGLVIIINMAIGTIRRRSCKTVDVTACAWGSGMCPREWKYGRIMIKASDRAAGRVTGKTGSAVVRVPVYA